MIRNQDSKLQPCISPFCILGAGAQVQGPPLSSANQRPRPQRMLRCKSKLLPHPSLEQVLWPRDLSLSSLPTYLRLHPLSFVMLGMEARASCMQGNCSTKELPPAPLPLLNWAPRCSWVHALFPGQHHCHCRNSRSSIWQGPRSRRWLLVLINPLFTKQLQALLTSELVALPTLERAWLEGQSLIAIPASIVNTSRDLQVARDPRLCGSESLQATD
jgi:hypothetical protein